MLSVVVLTKNEEHNLNRLLQGVALADEVIVVDDNSSDRTTEIALKAGAKVYKHRLNNNFALAREFGAQKAKGEWVLHVDADEEVTQELAKEIGTAMGDKNTEAFYIKRRDFFWGRELTHGEVRHARTRGFIRLHKKNTGQWEGAVHEVFIPAGPSGCLNSFLNHYPHPTLTEYIKKVNVYSTMRARALFKEDKSTNALEIIAVPFGKFFYTYFLRFGFLDGAAGFAYSFLMSFHSFLVRAKLYQYTNIDPR